MRAPYQAKTKNILREGCDRFNVTFLVQIQLIPQEPQAVPYMGQR